LFLVAAGEALYKASCPKPLEAPGYRSCGISILDER
jgi:hypothetical protein